MSAFGPKQTSVSAPHMSAFGDKADMTVCRSLLSRSLLGLKRTCSVAPHMSAYDPKRTSDRRRSGPPPVVIGDVIVAQAIERGFPLLLIMAGTHLQSRREGMTKCQTKPQRVPPC